MPVAVTVNVAVAPELNAAPMGCVVMAGAMIAGVTVSRNGWLVVELTVLPLEAAMRIENGEPVVSGGVPLRTPEVEFSVAHEGSPVAENVGAGVPVAVTVKLPASVALNDAAAALVKTGAMMVVRLAELEVAFGLMRLLTTTWNWSPFIPAVTLLIARVADVVPE